MEEIKGNSGKIWRPHSKQEEFLQLPFSIFEGFFGGAAGPGKTETLMMFPIVHGFYKHPGFKGILLRRTFPDLEKEIILRSQEYFPLTGGKYNEQKKRWSWPWGAYFIFGHAEHEKDIRSYDSAEYNYVAFDELTHFTEFQYLYLVLTRCRSSDPSLPAIVRSASNPGNIGHSWVRKRFIEPYKEGGRILEEKVRDITGKEVTNKRIFIPAYATDNPTLLKNDPGYLARMEMLPEAEKRAKIHGDWWTFSGQVFREFRSEKFPDEPANAIHVGEPVRIPDWWPRFAHFDWGTTAATVGYWGALSPNSKLYVYREYSEKGKKVFDWGTDFKQLSFGENVRRVGLCHSAFAQRGEEFTLAQQFQKYAGMEPASSGRDRIGGKMLLHDFLRWKPLETIRLDKSEFDQTLADKIYRFYGEAKLNEYLAHFKDPEPETNIPRLYIFDSCTELINTIPLCVYDETNKEDVAEFDGDDPYDSVRGLLKICDNYLREARADRSRDEAVEKVMNKLEVTNDQTQFYRQMEFLDAKNKKPVFGVRRPSRFGRR
jgi:hypothetical protein